MITYEPFYKTIKEKNFSTYKLINEYKPGEKVALDYRHLAKEIEDRILELSEGK